MEAREDQATVRVQGVGEVTATPDVLFAQIGIASHDRSVQAAQEHNRRQAAKVVAALMAQGVEAKDIQSARHDLTPVYDHSPGKEGKPPRLVAYRVEHVLAVRLRNLERAGSILDAVVAQGANRVMALHFGLSNEAQLRLQALRLAVEEAVQKARVVAAALGKELVGVQSIEENVDEGPPTLRALAEGGGYGATPVEPGELTVRVAVTAAFTVASRRS